MEKNGSVTVVPEHEATEEPIGKEVRVTLERAASLDLHSLVTEVLQHATSANPKVLLEKIASYQEVSEDLDVSREKVLSVLETVFSGSIRSQGIDGFEQEFGFTVAPFITRMLRQFVTEVHAGQANQAEIERLIDVMQPAVLAAEANKQSETVLLMRQILALYYKVDIEMQRMLSSAVVDSLEGNRFADMAVDDIERLMDQLPSTDTPDDPHNAFFYQFRRVALDNSLTS